MADLYEGLQLAPQQPPVPKAPPGMYDGLQEVAPSIAAPRQPQSLLEYAEAGWQGSALGLAWRRRLPDLAIMDPDAARWWERAITGVAGVGLDLPIMIPAGAKGAALGGAVAGPLGVIAGGGAAMFAAPAAIRTSLMEVYKAQAGQTPYDWFNIVREVAKAMAHEGAIGAVAFGTGAAARGVFAATMGATSQAATAVGLGTATMATRGAARAAGATDIAGQIAGMVTMPAALEGRLPEQREFLDAAVVILTLKGAHVALERSGLLKTTAQRIANVYERTGKTPAEQVADARVDAKVADDLIRGPAPDVPVPREADGRVAMPTIQEALFRDQARQAELEEAAAARPLADPERAELTALRGRIVDLEARIAAGEPASTPAEAPPEAVLAPEGAARAEARLVELEAKAASQSLADAERTERIFLRNNLERPEALARHFGIAAEVPVRITLEARDASAQRVYDDVLRQMQDVNKARQDAGLEPFGDDYARAIATLVRRNAETLAESEGLLPEDILRERSIDIRDATQAELARVEAEIPPEAPRYELPEVDLFGAPIAEPVVPRAGVEGLATVEVPLANLVLSKEVPQFKAAANEFGVIVPLGGRFDRTGVGPIQVWERLSGAMEVISGRHRLDLARRSGDTTIPAQIHREAEGFTAARAAALDAELNIREEQGSVADYVQHFKASGITKEAADELGLLARAKGRTGFAIARDGTDDLRASHRAGLLSDEAALSISAAAPGSERLQALGIAMVQEGKSILIAVNTMKAVDLMAAERMASGAQGDIFGFDDSAMREASAMAKAASSRQRKIGEQIAAVSGASKRPEIARRMGVNVEDPEAVRAKIVELRQEQELWDNWPLHPELVAQLRAMAKPGGVTGREGDLKQGPLEDFELKPETPAELEARNAEADAQAKRKLTAEAAAERAAKGLPPRVDQADLFNTQGTLFQDLPKRPLWYSELERQIGALPEARVPAEGLTVKEWKSLLIEPESKRTVAIRDEKNRPTGKTKEVLMPERVLLPGVKPDEIKWSGVEEWLDLQEGRVSRDQVLEYLRQNGVKVTEIELGVDREAQYQTAKEEAARFGITGDRFAQTWGKRQNWRAEQPGEEFPYSDTDVGRKLRDLIEPIVAQRAEQTKFSQWQLPGPKEGTYRELALTMPGPEIYRAPSGHGMGEAGDINRLAHIRFNERTDAEGKRVLFVEEIQSDWAQKGKKEGFRSSWPETEIAKFRVEDANDQVWNVYDGNGRWLASPPKHLNDTAAEALAVVQRGARDGTLHGMGKVPSAPFVGKTDAWVALTMKRMIRYAAENGFERIAWTTGEQQVSRYTEALRKAVDAIEWKKTPDGVQLVGYKGKPEGGSGLTRTATRNAATDAIERNDFLGFETAAEARQEVFDARGPGGEDWLDRWHVETADDRRAIQAYIDERAQSKGGTRQKVVDTTEREDSLSDAIGKAMADRIRNDPAQTGVIEGANLKIDDTGMAAFYDRIVPNVAKDVLKKMGGGKVGEVDLSPPPYEQKYIGTVTPKVLPQQGFDITPAMREKALQGMSLFQGETVHRASYNIAERLLTTLQTADRSSAVHELGHHFLENLKYYADRPGASARTKEMWATARREFAIGEEGTIPTASHEHMAKSWERYFTEGIAPTPQLRALFEQFKAWMLQVYNDVKNIIGDKINPEVRALFDRMIATDREIADAKAMDVPRAYVPEARAEIAARVVTPPGEKKPPEPGFVDEQLSMQPFAEELLAGPGSGATRDSRVNAQYINGPLDLKLAIQQVANLDQQNIQARRGGAGGVKSWEQTNAEADKIAEQKLIEDTFGGKVVMETEGQIPHDAKQRAAFKIMVAFAKFSLKMRDEVLQKGDNATIQDQFDYLQSIVRMRMAHAEFLGLRAAAARAMNQIRDMTPESGVVEKMVEITSGRAGASPAELFQAVVRTAAEEAAALKLRLEQIMAQHFSGKSALDIARLHADIKDLKAQLAFAKGVTEATKWDMVVEGWKASILSGPVTHTTNFFGTEAFQQLRAPVDALAAIIGMARGASPGMGESDRASMSEAVARLGGMLAGVQDGLKVAAATFRADESTGKTESFREAIPGRVGQLIRIPLRLMGAEDAMVTTMYRQGELATLAIRKAFDEGLNPSTREFAERVTKLKDAPTEDMVAIADQAATRMTFNAPLGEKGVTLQLFVAKWHLEWMIPFIRTPINITKEVARMSPFAPLVGEWRADIRQGGVARDRAIAEAALGAGLMAVTMAYAFSGQVTGGGSPDPGKARGKVGVEQPYSVKVGDKYYEYARIQPTGTLMGISADMAVAWDHMTDEEKDKIPRLLARAFSNAVTNQTFLQGITNVVNAMSDPTRFAPRFLQQLAGSMVPNIIGQPTAMADPVVREVNSALDAVLARLPGFRQDLLPKPDWLGEPVQTKERLAGVGPVRILKVSEDKVRLEAARLDISMAAAPKKTHIGKGTGKLGDVELTPEERNTFARVGGEMAHRILGNIVQAQGYDQIPDLVKRQIFSKVLTASHKVAAVAALPMEKRIAYIQSITEKVQAELAPAGAD